MTPDVNVLVAAARSDHPHHAAARVWLSKALTAAAAGASFTLMPMVAASVLRLLTSPKVFKQASAMSEAMGFLDALLACPGVHMASVGAEWPGLRKLCLEQGLGGNDVPDAWLAAAILHMGEHLATFDVDFRKLLPRSQLTVLVASTA